MDNEIAQRNNANVKKSNTSATIGFLLTILNILVSIIFLVTGNTTTCLIFASITALISLILCSYGSGNAKRVGKGRAISIIGIILNVMILVGIALVVFVAIVFAQACVGIFQGLNPN